MENLKLISATAQCYALIGGGSPAPVPPRATALCYAIVLRASRPPAIAPPPPPCPPSHTPRGEGMRLGHCLSPTVLCYALPWLSALSASVWSWWLGRARLSGSTFSLRHPALCYAIVLRAPCGGATRGCGRGLASSG